MSEQTTIGNARPDEIENVLRAEYEFTDEPLSLEQIDGVYEAIREVAETKDAVIVECDERVPDYKVYWNEKTDSVRVGAYALCASYEVPQEYTDEHTESDTDRREVSET